MNRFKKDLLENVYCRIGVSKIHGVGVIAIRDIPKGINPMLENRHADFEEIPALDIFDDKLIPDSVKKLVKDMCPQRGDVMDIPPFSLNEIGISFYLNHSNSPNMECDDDGNFYALDNIKSGTELIVDYGTYGAENLD